MIVDLDSWEKGYADGQLGRASQCPTDLDPLSYSSGWSRMSCRNAQEGPTPALHSIINRGASSTSLVLTELNSEGTSHLPKGLFDG
jgi:hypothetical protein